MAHVAVNPENMQAVAAALRAHSSRIQSAVESIETEIARLSADQFAGQRAEALRARFQALRPQLTHYATLLSKFAAQLEEAAEAFRRADAAHHEAASGTPQPTDAISPIPQPARAQAAQAAMRTVDWRKLW